MLSVTLETSGGIAGIHSLINVEVIQMYSPDSVTKINWINTIDGRIVARDAELEPYNFNDIIRLLNDAKIFTLSNKKYVQENLRDGFNEVLTITLNDGRQIVVENQSDKAPAAYYKITEFLRRLQQKKFPAN